jgi:hypothetical protein
VRRLGSSGPAEPMRPVVTWPPEGPQRAETLAPDWVPARLRGGIPPAPLGNVVVGPARLEAGPIRGERRQMREPWPLAEDLSSPDTFCSGVPHDAFATLRREAPVAWSMGRDGMGFWSVTRHADVRSVSRDPKRFSSGAYGTRPEEAQRLVLINIGRSGRDATVRSGDRSLLHTAPRRWQ